MFCYIAQTFLLSVFYPGGVLTILPWNGQVGGTIRLFASKFTNNGQINVSGKGYRGGIGTTVADATAANWNHEGNSGESVGVLSVVSIASNGGGGGGGRSVDGSNGTSGGGGGGYGTIGQNGAPNTYNGVNRHNLSGRGGAAYGNAPMAEVMLGSGGGSGHGWSSGV